MSQGMPASDTRVTPLVSMSAPQPLGFHRATWERWKKIARAVGVVQTRLLLIIFYFLVVLPLGLIMRIAGDPLHLKPRKGSNWTPHRHEEASVDAARRQF
jgi:hypothetical protein